MKITTRLLLGAAACILAASTANAAPILVNFTFQGQSGYNGTVTGQLSFAAAGTGVAATSAYVLTSTSSQVPANPTVNFSASASTNAFNVTADGVVTAANFYAYNGAQFLLLNAYGVYNDFQQGGVDAVYNANGFGGVTYTPVATAGAVPEPAAWAMMILGMGAIGFAMRRRNVTTRVSYAA